MYRRYIINKSKDIFLSKRDIIVIIFSIFIVILFYFFPTPDGLTHNGQVMIGILILAAILTPGADPVAQVLLAIPLVLLYEISIFVSKIFSKKIDQE